MQSKVTMYCKNCNKFHVYQVDDDLSPEEFEEQAQKLKCKDCKRDNLFLIDSDIAEAIQLLNIKGYTTEHCCSGHLVKKSNRYQYYSQPYIVFKSLFTMPLTVPENWRQEYFDFQKTPYNIQSNMDICALLDVSSRAIVPSTKDPSAVISKTQRDKLLENLNKWVRELPECYTNPNEKTLHYNLKQIDKNIDTLVIQSKIYNELSDVLNNMFESVNILNSNNRSESPCIVKLTSKNGTLVDQLIDAYEVNITADVGEKKPINFTSSIIIKASKEFDGAVSFELTVRNIINLIPDELTLNFTTKGNLEEPEYIIYDAAILTNAYLATEFIMYKRIKDYQKFEYCLQNKSRYLCPFKIIQSDSTSTNEYQVSSDSKSSLSINELANKIMIASDEEKELLADVLMDILKDKLN